MSERKSETETDANPKSESNPPFDLTRICDPDSTRYNLSAPWVFGGWRYATDWRIVMRVPAVKEGEGRFEPDTKPAEGKNGFPKAFELFDGVDFTTCTEPWEKLKETEDCQTCLASGQEMVECKNCSGLGEHYCNECEENHACGKCGGNGSIPGGKPNSCPACCGGGEVPKDTKIGCLIFSGRILKFMQDVPGCKYRSGVAISTIENKTKERALAFVGDGGLQGIAMPTGE